MESLKAIRIKNMIYEGISIPKISSQLNVSKASVYYHYKKIKGRRNSIAIIPEEDYIKGEFLGAFSGDGSFYYEKKKGHYSIRIFLNRIDDYDYHLYLKKLIEINFKRKVQIYYEGPKLLTMRIYSKKIYEFIDSHLIMKDKTKNVCLKRGLDYYSPEFMRYFVRGLFDTDGNVQNYRIRLKTISFALMEQVSRILTQFNVTHTFRTVVDPRPNCQIYYEITIRKAEMNNFLHIVGLSNPRKLQILIDAVAGIRTRVHTVMH